jgi:uncharacterized membrane protein (UPF0136 family)
MKKANMDMMGNVVLGIVVIAILLILGYKVVTVLQGTTTTSDAAYNAAAVVLGSNGLGLVTSLLPVAIIVLVFAGLLVYFKYFKA